MPNNKKGFTLIELLVVMGILGILMAVTILVINPAEYLKRSRDTQRISDIQTVNSAVALAIANGDELVSYANQCYATIAVTPTVECNGTTAVAPIVGSGADNRSSGGTGWVMGVDTSGSVGTLPIDPSNNATTFFYLWSSSATAYELNVATLESAYYVTTSPIAANDGGDQNTACAVSTYVANCKYEVGTNLELINPTE